MEINTRKYEKMKKQDMTIKSLVIFFNNFIEKNFKDHFLDVRPNEINYLVYFLELNVKLLSTNKIKYIISIDHSQIASESDFEFKENLFKFLIFFIFLINIHNKSFNCLLNLNKYGNIQTYASMIRKFYVENLIESNSYLKFLKIIGSLSLFSFDTNKIFYNSNSIYLNNLYKNSTSLNKTRTKLKADKYEGI
jgi:hypothetical protein